MTSCISVSLHALELKPPSDYTKIKDGNGVDLYTDTSNGVYVEVIDLKGGGEISFNGFYTEAKDGKYPRYTIYSLNDYYNKRINGHFSLINGQFFDNGSSTTGLAFPVKTNGIIKSASIWDQKIKKRTFIVNNGTNGYAYIIDGYNVNNLNEKTYKEVIVSLHPDENKSSSSSIGRNFVGVYDPNCKNYYCTSRYVLFFIAKNKTTADIKNIALKWGVSDSGLAMMDGSGSSQIIAGDYSLYGSSYPTIYYPDKRAIPHVILTSGSHNLLAINN